MHLDMSKMPPLLPNDNYFSTFAIKTIKNEQFLSFIVYATVNVMRPGKRIRQRKQRT